MRHTNQKAFSILSLFVGLFLLFSLPLSATIYYVDKTTGDDGDTGLTEALAWKTINKVNISAFNAGDSVLFKCGEEWREQLTVPTSGSDGSPITFGVYGEGADPIINGASFIATWTADGENFGSEAETVNWCDADRVIYNQYTTTAGGVIQSYKMYWGSTVGYTALKCAMFTDNIGEPDQLIADSESEEITVINANSWNTLNVTSGATLSASTTYWIAFWGDGSSALAGRDATDSSAPRRNEDKAYGAWGNVGSTVNPGAEGIGAYAVLGIANVWQAACTTEPNVVWFDGVLGTEVGSAALCNEANEWFWESDVLYVYSTSDPDTAYTDPGIYIDKACIRINNMDYITIQDLELNSSGLQTINASRCHDIIIDNIEADGTYAVGAGNITFYGIDGDECYNVTIQDSDIHHTSGATTKCIYIEQYCYDFTISNCTVRDSAYSNIELDNRSVEADASHDITVTGCTIYNTGGVGAGVEFGRYTYNHVVEKCLIYDTARSIIASLNSHDNVVRYNLCLDSTQENVLINTGASVELYNNVFQAGSVGVYVEAGAGASNIFKNNIFYNPGNWRGAIAVESAVTIVSDYNCFYRATDLKWYWYGVEKTSIADWRTASGQDANSFVADPHMIDPANGNFKLNPHSPCVNAGTSVSLTEDYEGLKIRHAPDIGAHENQTNALFFAWNLFKQWWY